MSSSVLTNPETSGATALINPAPPADGKAMVDAILKETEAGLGIVPDGVALYGISPPLLEAFVNSFGYFLSHKELSQELFATIRYLVSSNVECAYCIDFNGGLLIDMGKTPEQLLAARENPDNASLSESEKILLKIALASVNNPEGVTQEDLQKARDYGFTDRHIFDAVAAATSNRAFTHVLRTFKVLEQGSSF